MDMPEQLSTLNLPVSPLRGSLWDLTITRDWELVYIEEVVGSVGPELGLGLQHSDGSK